MTQKNDLVRTLPKNIEAEQMLLGSIIINYQLLDKVVEFLKAEHFFEKIHQEIYKSILIAIDKDMTPDIIILKTILDNSTIFQTLGGIEYLNKISILATTLIDPIKYAKHIHELALKRSIIQIGEEMVNNAYDPSVVLSVTETIDASENKLFELVSQGVIGKGFIKMPSHISKAIEYINLAMKNSDHVTGISTGLLDLDTILSGFHNSDLIILAARPGMGKTAFAVNFALSAWKYLQEKNKDETCSVGFFSLEMSSEQLALRILSNYTEIESEKLRSGRMREEEYNALRKAADNLHNLGIFVDDSPSLSISAIRMSAKRLMTKHNLKMLIIDYLQLMKGNNKSENRVLEITEITQGLKALAKELNIPIIALAQLSRAVEQRVDKRPLLSDLRESGSIEQDADVVMFLYREGYYLATSQPEIGTDQYTAWKSKMDEVQNVAEIIIAKHRHGAIGNVKVHYNSKHSKIDNYKNNR